MFEAGARLGGHVLIERIGPQGATEVWSARDGQNLQVTLQVGRVRGRPPEVVQKRLSDDLELAKRAEHPNVVRVVDAGVEDGHYFITSEPLDGMLLRAVLDQARAKGPWPSPHLAGYIVHQLARGLAYVHTLPGPDGEPLEALPRGLTPDRVVVNRYGAVKVSELVSAGESQDLLETAGSKQSGQVAYVSPESVSRASHDARSDVFALGAIFWELLTGQPPFVRDSDLETLDALRNASMPALPPGVPAELLQVAMRCLQRDPEARYSDADSVAMALEVVLEDHPDAGPRAMSELIAALGATTTPKKRGTAILSEASQGISKGVPKPSPQDNLLTSSGADAEARAIFAGGELPSSPPTPPERSPRRDDPFFDPVRDGAGLNHPRFEMLGRLGSGAMGEVYKVRDRELDEVVALKRIPRHTADSRQGLERLRREVRLARRIASDHVCRIFDIVDLGQGERGLTMAVIEGTTLAELTQGKLQLDYQRIARWGADIADGLAAAHALNVIHRDLKPENIMIRSADDRAVLLDFGIARPQDDEPSDPKLTQAGIIMGTPLYMSPEQLRNGTLDGRSDLYSLGLILAELVTSEVPLQGKSYSDILDRRALQKSAPYRLTDVDPGAPHALGDIVDRLLAQAPPDRPGAAVEVRDGLRAVAGTADALRSSPPGPPPRAVAMSADEVTLPPLVEDAGVAEAAPADPWRWGAPAIFLAIIALVLGFWVMQQRASTTPIDPDRHAAERITADGAAPETVDSRGDAGASTAPTKSGGRPDASAVKVAPPPPPVIPPAEEM